MFEYPKIDPVIIEIWGPLAIRWYGLMYLIGFVFCIYLLKKRAKQDAWRGWTSSQAEDMIFYGIFGVIIGGRLGSLLFYYTADFFSNPLMFFNFAQGGMSFHGGLLGVIFMVWVYAKRHGRGFFATTDFLAPGVPLGLGFGRIGNFINGELWGKPTDSWIGFKVNGQTLHASQLYEAFFEGLVLFIILWWTSKKPTKIRFISGLFLVFYGLFRFFIEFIRVPDSHIGYQMFGWVTRGQQLCFLMIVFGLYLLWSSRKQALNTVNN